MVGSNIGAGDIINIPPDYKYLDEKKSKAANAFQALNALITDCEDNLSNPMACQVADALTNGGYDIADNIFAADDGTVYMDKSAMADIFAALAPPAGPAARVTSTDDGFELVDGELIYTNGDCVVKIQEVSKIDNSHAIPDHTIIGDEIRIKNDAGEYVLLHEYPTNTPEQRRDVLRLIIKIYEDAQMYLGSHLYSAPNRNKLAKDNPAFELQGKIYINFNGPLSDLLSHKYNLLSTLVHENIHRNDSDGLSSFLDHALTYLGQIQHSTFESCTNEYKVRIIIGFGQR